jgi:hypothetical protein
MTPPIAARSARRGVHREWEKVRSGGGKKEATGFWMVRSNSLLYSWGKGRNGLVSEGENKPKNEKKMEGVRDDPMYETILLHLLEC